MSDMPNEDELEAALLAAAVSPEVSIERLQAEVARLNDENERLSFDYERLAGRKLTDEVEQWRAVSDELNAAIEHIYSTGWLVKPPMVIQAQANYQQARAR